VGTLNDSAGRWGKSPYVIRGERIRIERSREKRQKLRLRGENILKKPGNTSWVPGELEGEGEPEKQQENKKRLKRGSVDLPLHPPARGDLKDRPRASRNGKAGKCLLAEREPTA